MEKSHFKVAIIGTGFGGIGTAIRLKQEGEEDFIILERKNDVGGVWRDNQYPGCGCDVQSHLYSFSFAPNPNWSHKFSLQKEIHDYLKDCAHKFGILSHIYFKHEVTRLEWKETLGEWEIQTNKGDFHAQLVVGAFGALSDPAIPNLKGLETFKGQVFHSATWPKDFDLKGKRVVIVGTGASAIQFIPAIQPDVASMYVFQRTPAWVVPRDDAKISPRTKAWYRRYPLLQKFTRLKIYLQREMLVVGFRHPKLMEQMQKRALNFLQAEIKDPLLREKVTPKYTMGCKRILLSNTYYPALRQSNVEVVTHGISEITENSVVDEEGIKREVDTLIFGTGFQVQDLPLSRDIYGKDGLSLAEAWNGNPKAYMGTTVAGFPNLFLIQGPNTGLGHTSVIFMIESQVNHIIKVLKHMSNKHFDIMEPSTQAQSAFAKKMNKSMQGTVWTFGGCDSWYLDRTGHNSSLYPGFTFSFHKMAARIKAGDYKGRRVKHG